MEGILYESDGLLSFLIVTVAIGGGMAWAAGGSVAEGWKSMAHLVFYTFLLTLADRFLHYALFEGTLLSALHFVVDFLILLAFAWLGFTARRASQMKRQYGFRTRGDERDIGRQPGAPV